MRLSIRTLLAALAFVPAIASAQNGRIVGTVTQREAGVPVPGARVSLLGTGSASTTDSYGRYSIVGVKPGRYELTVQRIGYRMESVTGVVVQLDEERRVDVALTRAATELAGIVVSASRRVEKVTEAPATVTRIDARAIENTVGNSFSGALKGVEGVDFVQVGVTSAAINTRGFNSSFNNRVLMMEDGRIAVLPENGLPVGSFTTIPKVDLAAIEVLVGPGSALYGPDASNGVVTLETKDPKQYPGATIEIAGGSRSYMDLQGRFAAVTSDGRFGYKFTGEYQSADDFENHNVYAPIVAGGPPSQELNADWNTNVMRGGAAADYYMGEARLEASLGASKSNGIGPTNVGRNQLKDWQYRYGQLKYTSPNWFGQAYRTQSRSGETYQLNGYAQNRVRFPALTDDSVRHISDFPAEGDLTAAELQNNFNVPMVGTHVTYGGQFRQDVVSSKRQWLVDRQTGEDIKINQRGVYGQLEQQLTQFFRVIAAGRYDKHDYYKSQWSPKAGLLVMPIPDQTFRFTFNRAFKSPTILQTGFFFPNFSPGIGLEGNRYGFEIKNAAGVTLLTYAPIVPETNDTYEVGYKGVIANRLFADVTGYRTFYKNFMTPLVVIANPFTGNAATATYAYQRGVKFVSETGGDQITLTYLNLGKARIDGIDMGLRYLLTPTATLSGTMSSQKLKDVQTPTNFTQATRDEATAFNSPTFKWALGADIDGFAGVPLQTGINARHVSGYKFRSGVNFGYIPAFSQIDLSFGYKLPFDGTRLNVNVQNLFTCVSGETNPNLWIASGRESIYTPNSKCGFGKKHSEMINMPALGTMVFVGLRWDR